MASPQQQEAQGVAVTGVPKASTWAAASAGHEGAQLCPSPGSRLPHREATTGLSQALSVI